MDIQPLDPPPLLQAGLGIIMKIEPLDSLPMIQDNQGAVKHIKILDLEVITKDMDVEILAKIMGI